MRFGRRFECGWRPALVALLLAVFPASSHAQTTSASVSGIVQDAQGGVLPGVTVTMTSRTQGNALTVVTDTGGRFVFPIVRPDTYTLQAHSAGLQDAGADEPRRERQRQDFDRSVGARTRRADRRNQRDEPRDRAADHQRRALVHARKRNAEEHREQRPRDLQLRDAGARHAVADARQHRAAPDQRLHRERPAAQLEQHHDRRCLQHRHRRQRPQHGDDEHRRRRRVQDPDERVPGRVRARRRRPGAGRHQERHAEFPRLRLLVRTALRVERQLLLEQARDAGDPEAQDVAQRSRLHHRRTGVARRVQPRQEEAVLLLEPGIPAPPGSGGAWCGEHAGADGARAARRFLTERGQQRQPVPVRQGLQHRAAVQRRRHARLLPGRRRPRPHPREPDLSARPQRAQHLSRPEFLGRQRPELHEPGARQPAAA